MVYSKTRLTISAGFAGALLLIGGISAADEPIAVVEKSVADNIPSQFTRVVQPFLNSFCLDCHQEDTREGDLDLSAFDDIDDVVAGHRSWQVVLQRLKDNEMPPEDVVEQPMPEERQAVIGWIEALLRQEAQKNAGDPGVVLARRLSNAEYNYTIRDLTGVDIRPTREFPVDPANEAGFDNSGESLTMSPALLNKYLDAARDVADHLVLRPNGIAFAPHPVATDTDRDKYCVSRIIDFYERQPTDYTDYFFACWRVRHEDIAAEDPANLQAALRRVADEEGLSEKYLSTVWRLLNDSADEFGPIARLRHMWRSLPSPDSAEADAAVLDEVRQGCAEMREFVVQLRTKLAPTFENLETPEVHDGSQPLVLWKNRQYAEHRMRYDPGALHVEGSSAEKEASEDPQDPDLALPADPDARARHEAAFGRFCAVFPDAFYISERGRDYLGKAKEDQEKGRLLSAGFHSMMGCFRDDAPLYELVLDEAQQQELDRLWKELDFITSAPMRQHTGFVWFERTDSRFMRSPEFDFARAEDKDVTSEAKIRKLAELYLAKVRKAGGEGLAVEAIAYHFEDINAKIRWVEQARLAAEPSHLDALLEFAERAYRRPFLPSEREELVAFYQTLREVDELIHEEAIQDTLISVLMSPHFFYRMEMAEVGPGRRPLTDYELASRLSYFLWSSMPDEQLMAAADAGQLQRPEVLAEHARRMLQDERIRALAVEFGSNWLDFRRFEEHNSVDRERFPSFTTELRQAMFDEPIRFFVDVVQQDRSVLDLLFASHTFVNPVLAEHYGIPGVDGEPDQWERIDDADRYGRGGLLPMAVFLTKNAPGLRTSPVKRGYWVARRLLGEQIPPPPPNVPELPNNEADLGQLTLREALARHRDNPSCASCHERFDSLGLVFEGYGPVGERRAEDLGGRAVETHASFPGGGEGAGVDGLQRYVREYRQQDFIDNLCRKLLTYALGRGLTLSDEATLEGLRAQLVAGGYQFDELVVGIVTSPQFMTKRGRDHLVLE